VKWIRATTVTVGGQVFPYQGYEIHFQVSFDDTEDPDQGQIKIYNLTPDTENNIEVGDHCILESGYEGDTGTLLEGLVTDVHAEADGTERICTIEVTDGTEQSLNKQITKTFDPGTTASEVAEFIASEAGLEMVDMRLEDDVEYKRGYHIDGKARECLKDVVVNDAKSKCHVKHGGVYCVGWFDISDNTGITLTKDTGLIESPTRISGDHIIRSYEVDCLLEHRIRAGMDIVVNSETANGRFIIKKGTHKSDRSDHVTNFEMIDASATGTGPGGAPVDVGGDKDKLPDRLTDPSDKLAPPDGGPGGGGGGGAR